MDPLIYIGQKAPDFQLRDLGGNLHSLADLRGRIVVLNFWSAECVWCERVDHELLACLDIWLEEVEVLWIASNTSESEEMIMQVADERKLPIVLIDPQQQVADMYGAQTTPHFFVLDPQGNLRYQGAWDDITFRQRVATRVYLREAVEALQQEITPEITETPPYGCTIVRFST